MSNDSEIYIECRPTDEDEGEFKGEDKVIVVGNKSLKRVGSTVVSNANNISGISLYIKYVIILVGSFILWNAITFKVPQNQNRYKLWVILTVITSLIYSILSDTNYKVVNTHIYGYSFAGLCCFTGMAYIINQKDTSSGYTYGVLAFSVLVLITISVLFGLEV
jgi:hypothetical protein